MGSKETTGVDSHILTDPDAKIYYQTGICQQNYISGRKQDQRLPKEYVRGRPNTDYGSIFFSHF